MKRTYRNHGWAAAIVLSGLLTANLVAAGETDAQLEAQAKVSKQQAEQIALAKVPNAKIQSAEIEHEHHTLVWSFDMVKPGDKNVTEVLVHAKTGKIVEVSTENPADQAKEKAEDQAHESH